MIILCNEKEYDKKKFKKIHKIIISSDLDDIVEDKTTTHMHYLMPEYKLMNKFYGDEISAKKYRKKYYEYLNNDQIQATIITLMMAYKKYKMLVVVCSKREQAFLYMHFLLEYLNKKFGVPVITYENWKNKDCPETFKIDKEFLKKQIKKYKNILFGEDEDKPKKKKKDKKDKEELMQIDLPDIDVDEKIKMVKLKKLK